MVDTLTTLGKSGGGGSPAYFSGKEVYHDLSAGSLALALADMRKTHILYSSVDGKTVTLPAANTAGMAVGIGVGFRVMPMSRPIKILNAGTAGTNAILEAFGLPGADFALFANSVASIAGDWKGSGTGMFHGMIPATLPSVIDAGLDIGSVFFGGQSSDAGEKSLHPNKMLTKLSATLYVASWVPNAGTSVVTCAISYNPATDAWTWGAAVTAFTSANQWSYPHVIGLSANTFAVLAWEATGAKVSARACTVAGTVITQGVTIQSGAWSVNPTSIFSMRYCSLVADSATTFFWNSNYDATHLGITHFSVVGTTLTQDGGGTFGSSAPGFLEGMGGYSPSANNIYLGISINTTDAGIYKYTYAAGGVTNTAALRENSGINLGAGTLQSLDPTNNRSYALIGPVSGATYRYLTVNAGFTAVPESRFAPLPTYSDAATPVVIDNAAKILFLSEDEAVIFSTGQGATLFNPQISLKARLQFSGGVGGDNGHIAPAQCGWYSDAFTSGRYVGTVVDATLRRLAALSFNQNQTIAGGRLATMAMFDLPRNYDRATT